MHRKIRSLNKNPIIYLYTQNEGKLFHPTGCTMSEVALRKFSTLNILFKCHYASSNICCTSFTTIADCQYVYGKTTISVITGLLLPVRFLMGLCGVGGQRCSLLVLEPLPCPRQCCAVFRGIWKRSRRVVGEADAV